ncbi:MAG TPA: hypothetical protein G4O15_08080 [Dehalococcoidia bacterium]|nr:hypothetical protein [Dehalococcoidia bacterium]
MQISLEVSPSFTPSLSIRLLQGVEEKKKEEKKVGLLTCSGDINVEKSRKNGQQDIFWRNGTFLIPMTDYEEFMEITKIPILIPAETHLTGLDGTRYELKIRSDMSWIIYSWWEEPPEGWEVLGEYASKLIKYTKDHVEQEQS